MNRRIFLEKAMILGLGSLTFLKETKPWGKGLIQEASAAEPPFPGQDVLILPPFEKNNPFPLERALTERKPPVPMTRGGPYPCPKSPGSFGRPTGSTGRTAAAPPPRPWAATRWRCWRRCPREFTGMNPNRTG